MVETELGRVEPLAAILAGVGITCENISPVKFHLASRQPVIKQQANNSRHGDVEIDGSHPVVSVRLELSFEPAHVAPRLEVIICVAVVLTGDYFGQVSQKKRKSTFDGYYAYRHIMLVEYEHVTGKS